jgi:ribosome-binding factor A
MDRARARRLGEAIAQIVAEMLERRIKDPRLGFVTVTEARVTGDLREATVFYTVYGSAEERAESAAALASATGLIRSEVGKQTGLKHTPSITFEPDTVPDSARNIEELVARARVADAAVAAARQGAEPAGDPDPYRVRADPDSGEEPGGDMDADADAGTTGAGRTGAGSRGAGAGSGALRGPLGDYPAAGDGRARYSRS